MALKVYKPITAGTRTRIDLQRDDLTADKPEKGLSYGLKSHGGRGAGGRIDLHYGQHGQAGHIQPARRDRHHEIRRRVQRLYPIPVCGGGPDPRAAGRRAWFPAGVGNLRYRRQSHHDGTGGEPHPRGPLQRGELFRAADLSRHRHRGRGLWKLYRDPELSPGLRGRQSWKKENFLFGSPVSSWPR